MIFGIIKVSVRVISPVQSKAPRQRPCKADNTYLKRKNAKVISTRFRVLWVWTQTQHEQGWLGFYWLASFSLERQWCRALICDSRTSPCVAGKTNSEMTVPSAHWADVVRLGFYSLSYAVHVYTKFTWLNNIINVTGMCEQWWRNVPDTLTGIN